MEPRRTKPLSPEQLAKAIAAESKEFEQAYRWLEQHMPPSFHEEIHQELCLLITRNLLSYHLEENFSLIQLPEMAIVLVQDSADADLKIFKHYNRANIRHYRAFISNVPPPLEKTGEKKGNLRIAVVYFRESHETLSGEQKKWLSAIIREKHPKIEKKELESLLEAVTPRFLRSMTEERLKIALDMFFRAKTRDQCQYEVKQNRDWKKKEMPSLQVILAWQNVPKGGFLYKLAQIIHNHGLVLQRIVAIDSEPYTPNNILALSLAIHGKKGAAWEEADIDDLMREIVLSKYFETDDDVNATFVQSQLLTGNAAHLVRSFISFVHQALVHGDPNLYSWEHIAQDLCRHPELTVQLCKAFAAKFDPVQVDLKKYAKIQEELLDAIQKLDTGQAVIDLRRKNVLRTSLQFIESCLKTNFYRNNKSALSFRLDPGYLNTLPYSRKEKFPELPYAIFFIRGMHFIGFNIRFKDLARGGVRTVLPDRMETYSNERNNIFAEAYNLALTQQKKNKDIPEGGAKTAILLKPLEIFAFDEEIYRRELEDEKLSQEKIEEKLTSYRQALRQNYIFRSQRCFIESFMTLINCHDDGTLKAKSVLDYWKKPEYIYLGPDENMFNEMIVWISDYAAAKGYKPGHSFMSSKPGAGINHKQYGVTSFGVNVYMHETLLFLGIDPKKEPFTVKISGGPDGDVAGNQLLNLYQHYPKTAKLLALTDVSGTIYDPQGLDLKEMANLFHNAQSIRFYPPEKLSDGGVLLDLYTKRQESAYVQQTLCLRKQKGKLVKEWLSGNEMNHLYRSNVHQVQADIFIPGGGRPRTLNEMNIQSFLDPQGKPTARAIVEGANLYLTPGARRFLEKLGTLILKDSSCNKGGVICSSFEVLAGLCMSEKEFIQYKERYVKEVLAIIGAAASHEARLLLDTYRKTQGSMSEISDQISEKINLFKYQILDHLLPEPLPKKLDHYLTRCLWLYSPPLLAEKFQTALLQMPDIHKKAIIACYIAARLVYKRGLAWTPSIAELLPTLAEDEEIIPRQ